MTRKPELDPRGSSFERNWRWWVLATLFLATFLNYLDRQTLSNAIIFIRKDFNLDNAQRGELLAAFVYSYAFAHLFIGFILDRVRNIRLFFPVMVIGWSVSNLLVGYAQTYLQIYWLRVLLGFWESANFPICLLIIARIFPPRERSFAAGIFNSGAVIASLIAPKLVIWISETYNWRYSFIATGAVGILWLVPWLLIFRRPEERAINWPSYDPRTKVQKGEEAPIGEIFRSPAFWGVVIAGMGIIPTWYFISQWLPSYLNEAWQLPEDQKLANRLTLVYLSQDLGLWIGGGLVWYLSRIGLTILTARKLVILVSYILTMSLLFMFRIDSVAPALLVLCIATFGLAMWQSNQQAFKQDVSRRRVATVAALVGFAETGFAAFIVAKVGEIVQNAEHPEAVAGATGLYASFARVVADAARAVGPFNFVFGMLAVFFTVGLIAVFVLLRSRWLEIGGPQPSTPTVREGEELEAVPQGS